MILLLCTLEFCCSGSVILVRCLVTFDVPADGDKLPTPQEIISSQFLESKEEPSGSDNHSVRAADNQVS